MRRSLILILACISTTLVLAGSGRDPSANVTTAPAGPLATSSPVASEVNSPVLRQSDVGSNDKALASPDAPLYYLNWYSVNGGGVTKVTGVNFALGASAGQAAAGFVTGVNFKMGVGYWYGAAGGACPITLSGDVNITGSITSSDIIVLVNYVFKGGAAPLPCAANGDVNCNGGVTSSDIIVLVNFVFKGGAAPCNICSIIPGLWTCP